MADRTVIVRLSAIVSGYTAGLGQASAATKAFAAEASGAGTTAAAAMERTGVAAQVSAAQARAAFTTMGTAALAAGAAVLGGFGLAAKAAIDFQQQMANARTTVRATDAQWGTITQGVRDLAKQMPVTRESLAGMVEEAGRLGISQQNILSFTKTMEQFGASTDLSATDGARALAQLGAATQLPQDEYHRLASAVVALGNSSKTSESSILRASQSIAGAAHEAGFSTTQVVAFGTALASLGTSGQASLGIIRLFTAMSTAVKDGGTKLDEIAHTAGMTGQQFQTAFRDNAAQAILAFLTGLDKVHKVGGDVFQVLNDLSLGGTRGARVVLGLAATHDTLARSLETSSAAFQKDTALNQEAAQRWDTTAARLKEFANRVSDLAITMGNHLLPVINAMTRDLAPLVTVAGALADAFGHLPGPVQEIVVGFGLLGGASLVALGAIAKVTATILKLRDAYLLLQGAQATTTLAGGAEGVAGGAVAGGEIAGGAAAGGGLSGVASLSTLGPALLAALPVIAAVGAGLLTSRNATRENKKAVDEWSTALEGFGTVAVPGMGPVIGAFKSAFDWGSKGAKSTKDQTAALGPAAKASQDVAAAQAKLNDAVAQYGATSPQAAAAARVYNDAVTRANAISQGAAAAVAGLAGNMPAIGAGAQAAVPGVLALIGALINLQTLNVGAQGLALGAQGAILSVGQAGQSGGGGGGGGGGNKFKEQVDQQRQVADTFRKVQDAQRGVEDAQRKIIDQAFTLRDAYQHVKDAVQDVTRAHQQLADAQLNERDATVLVSRAQQHLEDVLHGVSAASAVGRAAGRSATDAGLNAQEAQINLRAAQEKLKEAQASAVDAVQLHGAGSLPAAQAADAAQQAQIDLTRAQEQATDTAHANASAQQNLNEVLHGAPAGSARARDAEQQLKDARKNLRDATNGVIDAERGLRSASEDEQKATLDLQRAQQDMTRDWQDGQRAAEDLANAQFDAAHAAQLFTSAAGGASGASKTAAQRANEMASAVNNAQKQILGEADAMNKLYGGGQRGAKAFEQVIKDNYQFALQNLGPNNPLTLWLAGLIDGFKTLNQDANTYDQTLHRISQPQILHDPHGRPLELAPGQLTGALGGTVPGPAGAPRMVIAHGGETLVPTHDAGAMAQFAAKASPLPIQPWAGARAQHVAASPDYAALATHLAAATKQPAQGPLVEHLYALDVDDALRKLDHRRDLAFAMNLR